MQKQHKLPPESLTDSEPTADLEPPPPIPPAPHRASPPPASPPPHEPRPEHGLTQSVLREVQALASLVGQSLEQTKQHSDESLARLREAEEQHNATREVLEDHAAELAQAREELQEVTAALIRLVESMAQRANRHQSATASGEQ